MSILPFFVVNTLGLSREILGAIEGSSELTSYAFRMVSGSLSDKMGKRKIFVLAGYGLSTISKPFFAVTHGWLDVILVRNSDRVGKGLREAPRDALIVDSVPESKLGKAFGLHRMIDQMGGIAGPIMAFFLIELIDIRGIFLVSLIPSVLAVIILIFFVKEIVIKKQTDKTVFSNVSMLIRKNRWFVFLLVIGGIFGIGSFNFSFILLKASDMGVSKDFVPLVYAVINVTYSLMSIPSGILSDKIRKEFVLILSYGVFILSALLMILLAGNSLFAYVIALVFGTYLGISETARSAIIPRYVPQDLRGTAFGLFSVVTGGTFFVGNVLFGFLWDHYGLIQAVTYSMIVTSIAIFGLLCMIRKYHNDKNLNSIKSKLSF